MDKDRVAGSAKKAKGSVKEAIGKVTGDSKTQAEGAAEKTAGRAGYWACHERVKAHRGPASAHRCADCGTAAVVRRR